MKNAGKSGKLLRELSRDPELRRIIAKARRGAGGKTRGQTGVKVENMTSLVLLSLGIASRFVKKKKARALDEAMDVIYLLVQVSLLLKENIFDRPEVKRFFSQSFRQIYSAAEQCVAMVLPKTSPKTKGARPRRALRPA